MSESELPPSGVERCPNCMKVKWFYWDPDHSHPDSDSQFVRKDTPHVCVLPTTFFGWIYRFFVGA